VESTLATGTTGDADGTPRRLVVGLVRGIHGLRGAVRLEVLTDDPARFDPGAELFAEGSDEPLTVDWSQSDGPGILIRFRERADRAAVEPLRDSYLEALVTPDARPAGSWYWHEVTGAHVSTAAGEDLGIVTDIFRTGGSEVFVVEGARGEILIPAVSGIMVEFAPADGRIVVDGEALALDETEPRSRLRGRRTTRARRARELGIATDPPTAADVAATDGSVADVVPADRPDQTVGEAPEPVTEVHPAAT
jgi:16S rRNA processing protein RimM